MINLNKNSVGKRACLYKTLMSSAPEMHKYFQRKDQWNTCEDMVVIKSLMHKSGNFLNEKHSRGSNNNTDVHTYCIYTLKKWSSFYWQDEWVIIAAAEASP